MRHRRDIRLRQKVTRQIRLDVEALEPGDAGRDAPAEQEARREQRADLCPRIVGPELSALMERDDLHQPPVALDARYCRRLEEACRAVGRRAPFATAGWERAQESCADSCSTGRYALREAHRRVALVARDRLVPAVADQADRHLFTRRFA